MPDINDADLVLFAGTSAGSSGAQQQANRVTALLRDGNPAEAGPTFLVVGHDGTTQVCP